MATTEEQLRTDLKELDGKVEGLTSTITNVLKSLEGYATTADFETIMRALASDREMLTLHLRGITQKAAQYESFSKEELDKLQIRFGKLEKSFIDFQSGLAEQIGAIKRKQDHDSGRIDDNATALREVRAIAENALRVARDAQTTAGNTKAEVDSLGGRVTTAESWLYGSFGFQKDGSSTVLTGINERLDRHEETLTEFGKRFEAIRVALEGVWKQMANGGFSSTWTIILLIIGGVVGWLCGEGLYGTVFTTIFGLAIGAAAGYVMDLIMNRKKSKKGVYRKSTPRTTTDQSANTTKETSA